ncbi:Cytochrome P450 3A24-like protein, partial [Dinothrombium tinctorium]
MEPVSYLLNCVIFALIVGLYVIWRKRLMSTFQRYGINGPKPHLFFGNMRELHKEGNVVCVGKWMKEYGPIFGYYVGARRVLIIAEPNILKQIQIKDFKRFSHRFRGIKKGISGDPIIQSELISVGGHRWKELRTILRQAFTASKLKNSLKCINDPVDTLIRKIGQHAARGEEFDIYPLFQGLTMEAIGRSAFGVTTNAQSNPNDEFFLATKAIFERSTRNVFIGLSFMFPEFEFILYPLRRLSNMLFNIEPTNLLIKISSLILEQRRKQNVKRNDLLQAMIDAKVHVERINTINDDSLAINSDMNANDQMSENVPSVEDKVLMKQMNDEEIVANTVLFFEAGYETTSTALAFVIHVLVNNEDVQEKVREEVRQLFEKE